MSAHYPQASAADSQRVPASPDFPRLEESVLEYWDRDQTFSASISQRENPDGPTDEFVFYDGPPFANGLPHYGHLLTGYVKDLEARYRTQRGQKVDRRFGWDTHGLPAELSAMKQLGMTDKKQIEQMGIDRFNEACRSSVLKYTSEWEKYVTRQARWVDFANDYKTLNVEYMESVIWAFKQLHEKGLTYEGFRVLPYCWKDETPLSNHELRMDDDVYQDRQDPTVTVGFELLAGESELSRQLAGAAALGWTTTPWTLPANLALAVGPEIEYVLIPAGPSGTSSRFERFLLADQRLADYAQDLGYEDAEQAQAAVTARFVGTELEGLRYQPLFDALTDAERFGTEKAWQILLADYVTTTDGTGVVHQAPAYGEEDQTTCERYGIPVVLTVDEGARVLPLFNGTELEDVVGLQVFESNTPIVRHLRAKQCVLRERSYVHSYPHCWRCRNPLIYRAITSWYVEVTRFKDRMVELNEQINWIPENVKHGQFGRWLENARDWSISRNRYWGSPIPVWVSDDPNYPRTEVYGSLAELEEAFGRLPRNHEGEPDLHRPFIDELTRPNPDDPTGRSTMRRVPDVLDVWFDSGSMPFAQVHYPFENKQWFENHYPADFIVEYIGQTRGWFYTLHILATALFDRPAFTNVISHGIVLGSDGQKMSKSLQNYPDVTEVLDRDGSDAMRWFLMSSPILRGGSLIVTEEGIREGVRQVMLPLWNVYHFFALYTNAAFEGKGYEARPRHTSENVMDRFILAETRQLIERVTEAMDDYDVWAACDHLRRYTDTLTNWYVRRSRERFFEEDIEAFDVLYTCLEATCRVAAPLLPLTTEEMWRGLTGGRSVHLTDWPEPGSFPEEADLVELMDTTRAICSAGSALRKAHRLRVRQPLAELVVATPRGKELGGVFADIIASELNLKQVRILDAAEVSPEDYGISRSLKVNARAAGPRLGKEVQTAIRAAKAGDWAAQEDGTVLVGEQAGTPLTLQDGEFELETVVSEGAGGGQAVSVIDGGFLLLDTELTPELTAEGTARDVIRQVQQARKEAGLAVADRISTRIEAPEQTLQALRTHEDLLRRETLSVELDLAEAQDLSVTVTRVEAGA